MRSNFGSLERGNDSSCEENKLLRRYLQMFIHTWNKQWFPFDLNLGFLPIPTATKLRNSVHIVKNRISSKNANK
jgi:hypothetical protein